MSSRADRRRLTGTYVAGHLLRPMRVPYGHLECDLCHICTVRPGAAIEHLIVCTAVSRHLRFSRSAQRFERDTYHGDALPTELRGRRLSNHRAKRAYTALAAHPNSTLSQVPRQRGTRPGPPARRWTTGR
jgi:hypothetical protein